MLCAKYLTVQLLLPLAVLVLLQPTDCSGESTDNYETTSQFIGTPSPLVTPVVPTAKTATSPSIPSTSTSGSSSRNEESQINQDDSSPTTQQPHTVWDNMNSTMNTLKSAETSTKSLLREKFAGAQPKPKRFVIRSNYKNEGKNFVRVPVPARILSRMSVSQSKQLPALSPDPLGPITNVIVNRTPCTCNDGLCSCCTGFFLSSWGTRGCMNLTYVPEEFAFDFKMLMNNNVLYKNRISGKNPRPICVEPPRFPIIEVCANFYDIYFVGRNVHVCLEMNGNVQGFELFSRAFDCLQMGSQGVKLVKPGDVPEFPTKPGNLDADVDAGDDIPDYDENVQRSLPLDWGF